MALSPAVTTWGFPRTLATPAMANSQGSLGGANRGIYLRAVGAGDISKVGLEITTSSGNISVAIYTGLPGRNNPGARKATSGAVACPTAGFAQVSLGGTVQVNEGDWFFLSADNTTALFRAMNNNFIGATGIGLGSCAYQNTAHPAPSGTPTVTDTVIVPAILMVGIP